MQTTQPLTQQELAFLKTFQGDGKSSVTAAFILGFTIATVGIVMLILLWDRIEVFPRFAISGFLLIGLLAVWTSIKKYFKNRREEEHPSHGQMKQVYSGVLTHTEVIKEEYIRYHFNGFSVEAWFAAPKTGHPKPHFAYAPKTEKFATLINIPVTLSVTLLEPGVNIVIGIEYDQQYYTESIQAMDVEDKKKLLKSGRNSAGCFLYGAIFGFILLNVISKFNFNTFLLTLVVFVIPALVCIRHLYRTAGKNVQAGGYKLIIKTTITEKVNQRIPSSDNDKHLHYLRLGNGRLTEVSGALSYKSKCNAGDEIVLEYETNRKGGRGRLLEIRNA